MSYYAELISARGHLVVQQLMDLYPQMGRAEIEDWVYAEAYVRAFTEYARRNPHMPANPSEAEILREYENFLNMEIHDTLNQQYARPNRTRGSVYTNMGADPRVRSTGARSTGARSVADISTGGGGYYTGGRPSEGSVYDISTDPGGRQPAAASSVGDIRTERPAEAPVKEKIVTVYADEGVPDWYSEEMELTTEKRTMPNLRYTHVSVDDTLAVVMGECSNIMADMQQTLLDLTKDLQKDVVAKIKKPELLVTNIADEHVDEFTNTVQKVRDLFKDTSRVVAIEAVVDDLPELIESMRISEANVINAMVAPIMGKYYKSAYINGEGGEAYLGDLGKLKNIERLVPGRRCEDAKIERDLSREAYETRFGDMCVEIAETLQSLTILPDDVTYPLAIANPSPNAHARVFNAMSSALVDDNRAPMGTLIEPVTGKTIVQFKTTYWGTSLDVGTQIRDIKGFAQLDKPSNLFGYTALAFVTEGCLMHTLRPGKPFYLARSGPTLNICKV